MSGRPDTAAIEDWFSTALRRHQAGRTAEAMALYRRILSLVPAHADSLHLFGLATAEQGDPDGGVSLIRRAMAIAPGQAPYHNSLAQALRLSGRAEEALHEYRAALQLRPRSAEIHNNLATMLCDLGRLEEALAHYRQAAECAPDTAEVWYNLANALADRGPGTEAETCFRRAIALQSGFADAHANYGRRLMTEGRWTEAEAALTAAASLAPLQAPVWNNLGITLQEQYRTEEAEKCYRRALALAPGFTVAQHNLGCLLLEQGRTDEAAECQRAVIAADPQSGAAWLAWCVAQLPVIYRSEAEIGERRRRYASALEELVAASASPAVARSLAAAIGTAQPFFLPYQGKDDRALQASYGGLACRVIAANLPAAPLAAAPGPSERIRLGILSGYFRRHTIFKLFLEGWLAHLDRSRFEVIGFHTGREADAQTAWAAAHCQRFIQGYRSTDAWRQAVSAVAPHVLLYPEIGMDPTAAWLAAQRLAPVQCVSWGQPETTGMPSVDYFLSSELMEPQDGEAHYTEQLVRLPQLGLCYLPEALPAVRLDRAALGLSSGGPVYWSGQALYKYRPRYDVVFPRIARAVGDCRFVFIGFAKSQAVTAAFAERLTAAFTAYGMDAAQYCVILPPMTPEQFVTAVGLADVVLDTPDWSGGKSTLDCLAQDPAIVTLPGRFMRGRHTAAILHRIGCDATIAASLDEYVAIAVRLGLDPAWRAKVRAAVARGKHAAFADLDYVRALERFLIKATTRIA